MTKKNDDHMTLATIPGDEVKLTEAFASLGAEFFDVHPRTSARLHTPGGVAIDFSEFGPRYLATYATGATRSHARNDRQYASEYGAANSLGELTSLEEIAD